MVKKQGPTKQQIALAKFGDDCEAEGLKPSHYYRLWPLIEEARAAIERARVTVEEANEIIASARAEKDDSL